MKTIQRKFLINAPIDKVWQALVDPDIIEDWSGGPVKMTKEEGSEFELWGGDIHGKNVKVVPKKELVQEWIAGEWDQPSKVTFTFAPKGNETIVELLHEDIPDNEADEIEDSWNGHYMGPLKEYVERFL